MMPYIPPQNRPDIDKAVDAMAEELAHTIKSGGLTARISELYRDTFMEIAHHIEALEKKPDADAKSNAQKLAATIVEKAKMYEQQGGWLGELNYAVTTLIMAVPFKMYQGGEWKEALRYWLYAETVGALVRTSYAIHDEKPNNWIYNGLAGVFEDVKDEYKRRVNTAYECLQIRKSGDCYNMSPFHTELVETEVNGVKGWQEVMLPQREPTANENN
ncbi:MAG: DUF6899 family protein [Candidatus Sumerlaeota bacterium]